jgi:hypothetical protein
MNTRMPARVTGVHGSEGNDGQRRSSLALVRVSAQPGAAMFASRGPKAVLRIERADRCPSRGSWSQQRVLVEVKVLDLEESCWRL